MKEFSLAIDELRLDWECQNQADRYIRVGEMLADAKEVLDIAKADYEVIQAEVSFAIRKNPEKNGLDYKPTEPSIKAAVTLQAEVKAYNREVIKAQRRVNLLTTALSAFDQRKRMLEKLVDLEGRGYFAEPRITSKAERKAQKNRGKSEGRNRKKK